jgi:hypothetical protein
MSVIFLSPLSGEMSHPDLDAVNAISPERPSVAPKPKSIAYRPIVQPAPLSTHRFCGTDHASQPQPLSLIFHPTKKPTT